MLQPLLNVWPKYASAADMELDLSSTVYGDSTMHEFLEIELDTELEKKIEEKGENISLNDIAKIQQKIYEA